MDAAGQQPGSSRLRAYFTRTRGEIRPGAHRLQRLCAWPLFSDLQRIPTVVVSGSNGKGSVCALLESALRGAGCKTALYTSPHLRFPNERLRFDGVPVSTECLDAALEKTERDFLPRLPDASFFEVATATCFLATAQARPDVFIAEVGLGGRFDAVNALAPSVSVLTSVGLEHTELLGDSEEAIAFDKAHIGRRARRLVHGSLSAGALRGLRRAQAKIGFLPQAVDENALRHWPLEEMRLASPWLSLNADNLATALAALEALASAQALPAFDAPRAAERVKRTFWPARFDVRRKGGVTYVLDGSHNPHAVKHFVEQWRRSDFGQSRPVVLFGALGDKDVAGCMDSLATVAASFVLTQPRSDKAAPLQSLAALARTHAPDLPCASAAEPAQALELAARSGKLVLCIGSLALMGDLLEALDEPTFPAGAL